MDYRILHAELQSRMDQENDRASQLEAVLIRKDEELDESLQVGAGCCLCFLTGLWDEGDSCCVFHA